MFKKIASAVNSLSGSPKPQLPCSHHAPARLETYEQLASTLASANVPVSADDCGDCSTCEEHIQAGSIAEIYEGKSYEEYIEEKYGHLDELPAGFDVDWESDLAGSAKGGKGRIVVVSTGKSDWERDHTDEKSSFSHQLHEVLSKLPDVPPPKETSAVAYIAASPFPLPSQLPLGTALPTPSIYSSSLISQSDDLEDQTILVFPDWKVVHEVENSRAGAEEIWEKVLQGGLGRAGKKGDGDETGVGRKRSWVLPYRAVVLLCSHKRRDKRCSIAAPLLRAALHTTLSSHNISIDETGTSLLHLSGPPLEDLKGSEAEREQVVGARLSDIEGVHGGDGGEVGIFNINHLGGHRYAGVMIILFPSGAYLSYGRVTPQEIPRVVEDTILQGKIVPGLLRNAVGVTREDPKAGNGFLSW
ncbi:hypothetical protein P7C73_g6186, partial [Tremellales sp. Uapishka_1]